MGGGGRGAGQGGRGVAGVVGCKRGDVSVAFQGQLQEL